MGGGIFLFVYDQRKPHQYYTFSYHETSCQVNRIHNLRPTNGPSSHPELSTSGYNIQHSNESKTSTLRQMSTIYNFFGIFSPPYKTFLNQSSRTPFPQSGNDKTVNIASVLIILTYLYQLVEGNLHT